MPILQEEADKRFAYIIKHATGKIIAGVEAYSSMYFIGYIDTLWVDQEYRHQGLGSQLMNKVEADLQRYGCPQCHLETFDYQAPGFYQKRGYRVFATLKHSKANVEEFFLVKDLD